MKWIVKFLLTLFIFNSILFAMDSNYYISINKNDIAEDHKINANNYFDYINNIAAVIRKENKDFSKNVDKHNDFIAFSFYILSPVFENYLVLKFKNKWVNLYNDKIQPDEKFIFPQWIKTWAYYFNQFLKDIKDKKIKVQDNFWNRKVNKDIPLYNKLSYKDKKRIFKIIYYGMYNFNPLARVLRTKVIYISKK